MSVLLTVAQNRFLLNSLRGEGFLNMRLTDAEAAEAVGIDPVRQVFEECMRRAVRDGARRGRRFQLLHARHLLPARAAARSPLWRRVREGLRLFGVAEDEPQRRHVFRLDMVQRPRFTAELSRRTAPTPGTYGFLLGDAANAIHFWPGRGLNSGLASAISLARTSARLAGQPLRDADFVRHEAADGDAPVPAQEPGLAVDGDSRRRRQARPSRTDRREHRGARSTRSTAKRPSRR